MEPYTIKRIAKEKGTTVNQVNGWRKTSKVAGYRPRGVRETIFTREEAEKICVSAYVLKKEHPIKIKIAELYNKNYSVVQISKELHLCTVTIQETVDEFRREDTVTVASKLNRML